MDEKKITVLLSEQGCSIEYTQHFTASEFLFIAKLIELKAESVMIDNIQSPKKENE